MVYENLVEFLVNAEQVAGFTGAGISVEVGIPTFRGPQGLWEGRRPEEVATPRAFKANPQLVWNFYLERRKKILPLQPGPSHQALAELEKLIPQFHIITQNVDGLHRKAGSENVLELHGNIAYNKCSRCSYRAKATLEAKIPACPKCDALMRPDVVWFEEPLNEEILDKAHEISVNCDVFLSIGTSTVVYPAAVFPYLAKERGAKVAEINPKSTPFSPYADWVIREPSSEALPKIVAELKQMKRSKQ